MKNVTCLFLLLTLLVCNNLLAQNSPKKIFLKHIQVVEKLFKGDTIYDLETSIKFLESLTGTKSEINFGFVNTYEPTEQNLKDWKCWYKENKNFIYFFCFF